MTLDELNLKTEELDIRFRKEHQVFVTNLEILKSRLQREGRSNDLRASTIYAYAPMSEIYLEQLELIYERFKLQFSKEEADDHMTKFNQANLNPFDLNIIKKKVPLLRHLLNEIPKST